MPIDASIYNQVKMPPSPLDQMADVSKLKEAQQNQQINAIKLNQAQQAAQDQQLLDQAYQKFTTPDGNIDYQGMAKSMASSGHGHLAPSLIESGTKVQESIANAVTAQGKAETAQRDVAGRLGLQMQDLIDKGAPIEDVAALGYTHLGALGKAKLIAPDDVAAMARSLDPSNPDVFKRTVSGMIQSSPEASKLQTERTTANARQTTAATGASEAAVRVPLITAQTNEATARIPLIAAEAAKAKAESDQTTALNTASTAANQFPDVPPGQKNEEFLKSLPSGIASQVKMLAEGKLNVPAFALRTPYWQGLLQATAKYDPSFDTVNYNARNKTRADFTSGASAKQVNAINTVIGHLDNLSQATDALNNSDYPLFNKLANVVSKATGSSKVTNFDTIKKAVSDEVTRVWRQSGGSEQDIQAAQKNLDAANSPEQLHGAIATYGGLLESKLGALNNQYKQGMGTDNVNIVTPESRATLSRLEKKAGQVPGSLSADLPSSGQSSAASTGGSVSVTTGDGKTRQFSSQAKADAFKKAVKAAGGTIQE